VMPAAAEAVAATSGMEVFLEHGNVQAALGQVGCGGDSTQAGADNEDRCLVHSFT
jgi:hypothetical protein